MTILTPAIFSTDKMSPTDQLDAWREWFNPVFEIGSHTNAKDGFSAQNKIWDLGSLLVSKVTAPPVNVSRSKINISRAPVDHWILSFCQNGSTMIETGANTLSVAPGTPYLWSLGQQSISERSRVERIQVILPRDEFHSIASSLDAATGTILNNPLGRLLSDYLVALDRWLPSISAEDSRRLAAVMHSMISACIAPSSDRVAAAETGMSCARKERVRRIIHQHLRSPELSPSTICKMGGVSRSQMYRLFEHDGGVAHYIQRLRLQAAYAILSDPSSTRRIYEIASDFCFEDASSFTRAFRHEFDCAPRDVRAAALDGLPLVANVGAQREKAGTRFVDFLA